MAEAAQANQGGLECSSYAWQVRQFSLTRLGAKCQERSAASRMLAAALPEQKHNNNRWLIRREVWRIATDGMA